METGYKYGDPIPIQYRNRLFDWEGGGYSGCTFEFNQGLVDNDGHWIPIYSSGCSGIDQDEWYDRKIRDLKADFGYDVRPAKMQFEEVLHKAVEKVFGKKWYEVEGDPFADQKVKGLVERDKKKYDEFVKLRDGYRLERTHRLDAMFMQVVTGEMQRNKFEEIGQIDEEHIKETCRAFCESYKGNVGMMTHCLDRMAGMGYDVWCRCSDCGDMFQPENFSRFSESIDDDDYTGDGGIGVIMKRVLCDACHEETECHECMGLDLPNERRNDGKDPWAGYGFLACVILDWLGGVCCACSDGFEDAELECWDETRRRRVKKELGERFDNMVDELKDKYGLEDHALYEELRKTLHGKKKINEIRNLLNDAVARHFPNSDDHLGERYDTEDPRQMKLPGFEG